MSKRTILLSFILLFSLPRIFADHIKGAEITYKPAGGNKYEIMFRIYRDCRSVPFSTPNVYVYEYSTGNYSTSVTHTRTSIEDITKLCPDSSGAKVCVPANTSISREGLEMHTFKATIDFGSSPFKKFIDSGICKVGISVSQSSRSTSLTTVDQGSIYYVDAMIDLCMSGYTNSAPQFPSIDFQNGNCNQPFGHNFGGVDYTDYD